MVPGGAPAITAAWGLASLRRWSDDGAGFGALAVTPRCYTEWMPTKHRRIAVIEDDDLAEALEKVRPLVGRKAASVLVRELAMRGVESLLDEEARRRESMEELIRWSTTPGAMDRGALREARRLSVGGETEEW